MTWRESTRSEIQQYYREEFPTYQDDLPGFTTPAQPKEYALAFKDAFPTVDAGDRPFIRRATRPNSAPRQPGTPVFDTFEELLAFIQTPADNDPITGASALADPALVDNPRPVSEAVYYAADMWTRSWLLWVDIDAKDVARERASEEAPTADDPVAATGITNRKPPYGYPYAFEDIQQALAYGFEVEEFFSDTLCGEETMVVYSGQGCHVYLLDDDMEHDYDEDSREVINDVLTTDYEIPIDTVVTADRRRVARLPYSLHAGVSRIVTPIDSPDYNFQEDPVPEFLAESTAASNDDVDAIALPGETE
jgi:hypothetical protein